MNLRIFLASAAATPPLAFGAQAATLPSGWTVVGTAGTGSPNGVVTAPSATKSSYYYVSTDGGSPGGILLNNLGGNNASTVTTGAFATAASETLEFLFNYVTGQGGNFADYGWARLTDASTSAEVALLFAAHTTPGGNTVPGYKMPPPNVPLVSADTPIVDGAPIWIALGPDSDTCSSIGCGYTDWTQPAFDIVAAGTTSFSLA